MSLSLGFCTPRSGADRPTSRRSVDEPHHSRATCTRRQDDSVHEMEQAGPEEKAGQSRKLLCPVPQGRTTAERPSPGPCGHTPEGPLDGERRGAGHDVFEACLVEAAAPALPTRIVMPGSSGRLESRGGANTGCTTEVLVPKEDATNHR
jgi:hypothetical protein